MVTLLKCETAEHSEATARALEHLQRAAISGRVPSPSESAARLTGINLSGSDIHTQLLPPPASVPTQKILKYCAGGMHYEHFARNVYKALQPLLSPGADWASVNPVSG